MAGVKVSEEADDARDSFMPILPLKRTMFPRTNQSLAEFLPEPEAKDIDLLAILGDRTLPNHSREAFELFKLLEEE